MKVIFHIDLDSFFVSAHRSIDPSLNGKSVVVSSGEKRAIISAVSYEGKAKGLYVPMPFYKAKELDPNVTVVDHDFALYTTLSAKMFEYIGSKYTSKIEVASVDECYVDVTDIWKKYGSIKKLAHKIQDDIKRDLKLPISIGISDNKFVAKMSTSINKPFGITIVKPGDFLSVAGEWELTKFYGIGGPTALKLNKGGLFTIRDLAEADLDELKTLLGSRAESYQYHARGFGSDELDNSHNALKSIGNSQTFMKGDKFERIDILDILGDLTSLVSHRATLRNMIGTVVAVSIKESGGKEVKRRSKQVTLNRGINTYDDIFAEVKVLFDALWDEGSVKFVGVTLTKLVDVFKNTYQMSFFDPEVKKSKIDGIVSRVNSTLGEKGVMTGKEASLNIKRNNKQSRYIESDRIIKHFDTDYNQKEAQRKSRPK